MMKYSFILLSGETEGFLEKLQELGVVDVTRSARPVDEQSAKMLDDAAAARRMILKLEGINYEKDADKEAVMKAAAQAVISDNLAEGVQKTFVELMELEVAKTAAEKEVRSRLPWGEFDKARLDQLETLGYAVRYYTVPAKKFSAQWNERYFKIKECLARCGNIVMQFDSKQEVEKIIYSFLNVRKELKII